MFSIVTFPNLNLTMLPIKFQLQSFQSFSLWSLPVRAAKPRGLGQGGLALNLSPGNRPNWKIAKCQIIDGFFIYLSKYIRLN